MRRQRKREDEARSGGSVDAVTEVQLAPEQPRQPVADRETETRGPDRSRAGGGRHVSREVGEQSRLGLSLQPRATVDYLDGDDLARRRHRMHRRVRVGRGRCITVSRVIASSGPYVAAHYNGPMPAGRRVLDRVREPVRHDLAHARSVGEDLRPHYR